MLNTSTLLVLCGLVIQQADVTSSTQALRRDGVQSDFPALAVDAQSTPWVAYVEWDGKQDSLRLAKRSDDGLAPALTLGTPGIIHQPTIARAGDGSLVVVWSQVNEQNLMDLKTQRVRDGKLLGHVETLAASATGGNAFARAATDRAGRVWVVWQAMRGRLGDIYCRYFDAKDGWSKEVRITTDDAGEWEPSVAFDNKDGAWVIYDSSRGNEFNVYANRVSLSGEVGATKSLIATDRYEGRVSVIGSKDGSGIWIACERGNQQWGLDMRAHGGQQGLNGRKDSVFAYWDLTTGKVEELPSVDSLLLDLPGPPQPATPARGNNANARAKAAAREKVQNEDSKDDDKREEKPAAKPQPANKNAPPASFLAAVNLPRVFLDGDGRPWLTVRYFKNYCWRVALSRFDMATRTWTQPVALNSSAYGQDRVTSATLGDDGSLWLCWPSDLRNSKLQRTAGIQLVKVTTQAELPLLAPHARKPREPFAPYINEVTPERPRDERHAWTHNGTTYKLYWGDFHRHTDVSNCITANDGCVVEQFRYAYDMGKLDMLGTSDHTDIAKIYHPYEWWLNQKLVDVFFAPGFFNSMYAYEREQKWPYGHRNIVFAKRGGPIVYIQRANYVASPWQKKYPVDEKGPAELSPDELWDVLVRCGLPVTAISHTGATGMGTDWNIFQRIDHRVENVIEIFQGARVSYEGLNAPQPTVGLREKERYNPAAKIIGDPIPGEPIRSFTDKDNGLYQNALKRGHKLGVWANSDHISTHTSYGGVYVKEFTREGIIEGLNARRTIAATDKIFVEFTCNDQLLGSEITTSTSPVLKWSINGTSSIKRVTLVRNEQDYQSWTPNSKEVRQSFTDSTPLMTENRYYIRIEQSDGNMAWSSPVWVEMKTAAKAAE